MRSLPAAVPRSLKKLEMASSDRIDELRKKFEENPRRYFAPLANEYRKAGDVDQAIAICRDYLPQQPGHMSGHIVYGQALYEGRQFEEAKTVFETALSLDPENLIALRHLGDIALILGDTAGARSWYGRVLEADPRNEEIQAQLKSLEAAAPPPPTDDAAKGEGVADVAASAPTPASPPAIGLPAQSAPTVVVEAMKLPTIERTEEQPALQAPDRPIETLSTAPTAEITLDSVPMPGMPEIEKLDEPVLSAPPELEMAMGFEPTSAASDAREQIEPLALDAPVSAASVTSSIDSFTLEGLETTSMSAEPAEPAHPPAASDVKATADAPLADLPPLDDLRVEAPAVNEASGPTPPVESAAPQPTSPTSDLPMLDLSEGQTPAAVADASSDAPTPSAPPTLTAPTAPAAPPVPTAPPTPTEAGPFVTETMAELYLSQGHRDEALRVYRALLDQRPDDAQLRSKFEKLQADSGPTIRELIARFARRRPGAAAPSPSAGGNGVAEAAEPAAIPAPESAPVDGPAPPADQRAEIPVAQAPVAQAPVTSGSTAQVDRIAATLNAPAPAEDAERAARVLSSAFAGGRTNGDRSGADGSAMGGAPARPASKDLSLDTVFGSPEAKDAPPASFSFDQFFSQRATAEGGSAAAGGGGQESRDDVAKFTQWLEGLKQR